MTPGMKIAVSHQAATVRTLQSVVVSLLLWLPGSGVIFGDTVTLQNGTTYRNVHTRLEGETLHILGKQNTVVKIKDVKSLVPGAVTPPVPRPVSPAPLQKTKAAPPPVAMPEPAAPTTAAAASSIDETARSPAEPGVNAVDPIAATDPGEPSAGPNPPPSLLTLLAIPIPGLSPYFFYDQPVVGSLSGSAELLALYGLFVLAPEAASPGLATYLPDAAMTLALSTTVTRSTATTSGYQYGSTEDPATTTTSPSVTMADLLRQAWIIQTIDQNLNHPVIDPFTGNRINKDQFNTMRNAAWAIYLSTLIVESSALLWFDEPTAQSMHQSDQIKFFGSILPDGQLTDQSTALKYSPVATILTVALQWRF